MNSNKRQRGVYSNADEQECCSSTARHSYGVRAPSERVREPSRWLPATVPKGASKGRFRRTGEARRVATAAEKLTGTLQVQVLPPRRPPQSLHARAQLQSSTDCRRAQNTEHSLEKQRVGARKLAALSRQSTSRNSEDTPRSGESIRKGCARRPQPLR